MEKKNYFQPQIRVRKFEFERLLDSNSVTNVNGDDNTDIGYGGGGDGPAYAPQSYNPWDDSDEFKTRSVWD